MLEDVYGHTSYRKAIEQKDVYGIAPDREASTVCLSVLALLGRAE